MWVGYRSVFGVDWKEAGHGAQIGADRMAAWLRAEGFEEPFDTAPGRYKVGGGAVLTVTEGVAPGRFKAARYRLKEAPRAGVHWYTSLTSVSLSRRPDKELKESGYFLIEVSARAEDGVGAIDERVRTPDLTGLVLDAVTAFDGPARLTTSPQVLGVRDIDELITVLCDPGRRLPAIVAVPGEGEDLEPWRARFTEATRYLPGIASLYLLDEEAGRKLNGDFEYHWTMAALRTFKPGVDPASREDAERHRVLKGERLEHEMDAVQAILTHRIRAEAAAAPLPRPLEDVADVLYESGEAQRADAARLRRTFVEMGVELVRPAADERDAHLEAEPSPFDLLADSFSDYPNLLITAEAGPMGVLDRHKDATTFAGKAREALAALDSYAAQRRSGNWEGGGFRRYCEDSRHGGRIYPATQVASLESDTVRQDPRLAEQRRFRVPRLIDPSGYAEFWAHVKIGNSGQTAPRLHYYDDTSGPTGAVVVGYIGPHLRNTRSS
ncbi:hypothetical protein KDL01_12845 [Actinospica durhamensis]|uniref:Uncharacterized protein n=1 Tax=Actinospica durhamensis TaxID=1508375 RepID=A0A941EKI8_9ACTN|nr:hypothetical protein [Actinospica durhamensis]MBR7834155.1 hypothetical protein [Actinospica durhamensis]